MDIGIFVVLIYLTFLLAVSFLWKNEAIKFVAFLSLRNMNRFVQSKPADEGRKGGASHAFQAQNNEPALRNRLEVVRHNAVQQQGSDQAEFSIACFGSINLSLRTNSFYNGSYWLADLGSFALIDDGLGVLIPTGSYGYCFSSASRDPFTSHTQAHNLPLLAGQGQLLADKGAIAGLIHQQQGIGWICKKIDLSQVYHGVQSFIRTVILIEGKGLVIWDSVQLHASKSMQWRLHSHLEAELAFNSVCLQEDETQYLCTVESNNRVAATIEPCGYGNEMDIDAMDDGCLLQWDFPESKMHNVVVSCLKTPLEISVTDVDSVSIKLAQGLLIVDRAAASCHVSQ